MREAQVKEIDGKKYTFGLLSPFVALRLKNKILKMVAPVLGGIDLSEGKNIKDANINLKAVADGIISHLDEERVEEVFKTLFTQVAHNGNTLTDDYINANYKGDLNHLYKVAFAALEVQYGDFFGESGVLAGLKGKVAMTPEK
jgi:hypothetical protein